jgi:hypothetical protein
MTSRITSRHVASPSSHPDETRLRAAVRYPRGASSRGELAAKIVLGALLALMGLTLALLAPMAIVALAALAGVSGLLALVGRHRYAAPRAKNDAEPARARFSASDRPTPSEWRRWSPKYPMHAMG